MRQLASAAILAFGLLVMAEGTAWAGPCPGGDGSDGVDQSCGTEPADTSPPPDDSAAVADVDGTGAPIPYVEEITAPPDGTALTFAEG